MDATTAHRRRWGTLGVMCLSLTLIGLDNTILNVALPTLVRDLDATDSQLQWMVDSYTLIFAGLLLTAGTLGDRFGRKRSLFLGLAVFGLASVWAAWAGSANGLIVARTVMGIGGAFIMPATLSVIIDVFRDPIERGKAIGIWAAVSGLAIIGGPSLGGWLLTRFWWGSVFLINVPLVLIAVLAGVFLVPESRDPRAPRVDLRGMAISVVGLSSLVWAVIEAPRRGWTSGIILGAFAASVALMVVFVLWERRVEEPMLDLRFFNDARFSASSAVITLAFFALLGSLFFLSQYLQFVLGYDPLGTGVRLLPFATMAVGAPAAIALAQRIGVKPVVTAGMAIIGIGLVVMAQTGVQDDYTRLAIALGTMGFGMGVTMAPATEAVMASLPPAKAGVGSAVNDTTRQVGGALGVAVLGSLLASQFATGLPATIGGQPLPPEVRTGVGQALQVAAQTGGERGRLLASSATDAFIGAMGYTVMVGALVAFAGAMVAAVWLPMQPASMGVPMGSTSGAAVRAVPDLTVPEPAPALPVPAVTLEKAWTAARAKASAGSPTLPPVGAPFLAPTGGLLVALRAPTGPPAPATVGATIGRVLRPGAGVD
jgi:DHA2 family multidrug resistance protein-like MFS transporter